MIVQQQHDNAVSEPDTLAVVCASKKVKKSSSYNLLQIYFDFTTDNP